MTFSAISLFTCAVVATALPGRAHAQQQQDKPAGESVVIEVGMQDHAFWPTNLRIPAGQRITPVANSGSVDHEFATDDHGAMVGLEPGQHTT